MDDLTTQLFNLLEILFAAFISILATSITYSLKKKEKSRDKWFKILSNYDDIKKPYEEFDNNKNNLKDFWKNITQIMFSSIIGSGIAFIIFILFYLTTNLIGVMTNEQIFYYSSGIMLFFIVIIPLPIMLKTDTNFCGNFTKEYKKITGKLEIITNYYAFLNIFVSYIVLKEVYTSLNQYENTQLIQIIKTFLVEMFNNYLLVVIAAWVLGIFIGVASYTVSRKLKKQFIENYQKYINAKYSKNYPYLITNRKNIQGKLCDVFNEDILILNKNGAKMMIPWDKIETLEVRESPESQNQNCGTADI
ncbi:MAG: hypothetical protein PWQ75_1020 [Methanolobus sp.]|jgi:hypothetical protein|uniref:hypothetical protein n=1 Tax=Methanolobus sp. TaxID=1874737 RepID=UPI0024AAD93A|nr:hypothetical protein [Methanolobus sp.]MDI3484894.1 hypothetical protein [Methanolobus sp.]MDK2831268.1 hypothetical protein [Methanolobus sp.]